MTRRAAIYVRISKDREGAGLGVERQEADCRDLAQRVGWTVAVVHTDNDLSAYSGKPRPGYRALLADLEAERVDAVLAWHPDRLHRRPIELEEFISVCSAHAVAVQTVRAGEIDLNTPTGQAVARTVGAWARHEVDHMIDRQRAAKAQAALDGRWRGGRRPFGYEADGITVRADEAAVVVEVTDRLLAGETLSSVARDLNTRGVTTSTGREWKSTEVRSLVMRARNAGLIENCGVIVGSAKWDALVDPAKWRSVVRLLNTEGRRAPRSADIVYLGSGLYRCGWCGDGTTMKSAATRTTVARGGQTPAYRCRTGAHLTRAALPLDELVSELVIERLSLPDARLMMAGPQARVDVETLYARHADAEARLTELAGLFADGLVTGPQLAEGTRKLRAEVEELDGQLSAASATSPLAGFADAEDVRAAWEVATVGRRKTIVRALMTVTLLPAPKGRPKGWRPGSGVGYFDPKSVAAEWL